MKILAALSRFPWPIEKGDKLRAYYQLKGLAAQHEVHLICLSDEAISPETLARLDFCASVTVIPLPKWRSVLNLFGGLFDHKPFQVHYFHSSRMKSEMQRLIQAHQIEVVFVQLIRLGMNLPENTRAGWFLDYMDTFSIGMTQRVAGSPFWMRGLVRTEARRLQRYEAEIAQRFQGMSVISERDAEGLPGGLRPRLLVIPNGVGEAFFEEMEAPATRRYDLVFFGNMGYHPNVQSARFLMEEVVPALEKRGISPRICFAGARPAPVISTYASERVTVTGFVDDIRSHILASKLAIAPVIAGQGMQNKLLESMALGLPTLTTPLAHAAVPAQADKEIVVCADAEAFAEQIEFLLNHPEQAAEIGRRGRDFVARHYRWAEMNARLEGALRGLRR